MPQNTAMAIPSVEELVSNLLSSSEEKQSEGESMFDMMKEKDVNSLALDLVQLVGASNSHGICFREKCVGLLDKLLTDDSCHIWENNLSVSTQSNIKSLLLIHINIEEYSQHITQILCAIVATLWTVSNDWHELNHFLHDWVTSDSNRLKHSFFLIFGCVTPDICQTLVVDIMAWHPHFLKSLNDHTLDLYPRIYVLSSAVNFIQCVSSLNELKTVLSLYPGMMWTLTDLLSKDCVGDASAQYLLQSYIQLAKNEPRFFRLHIVDVVNAMFEIAEATSVEEKMRHLALEFLLTLVEAKEKAPGMMKKIPLFTHSYFALLLNLLLDVEDEPNWHSAQNCLDWTWGTENYKFGWACLLRFSNALGGKTVAHIAIEQLGAYLVSHKWEKRHAALIALVYVAEGCSKVMIKYLKRIVSMVLHCFQDPHPRVRWAAIVSVIQLSMDFSPDLQEQHHNKVVPALVAALDDLQNPKVQAVAAVALRNCCLFSKNLDTLPPYFDIMLNKLLVLLQSDNQMVLQEALGALTAVAELSKEHFHKYYGFIIPHLKTILVNENEKYDYMLWSKALDCISMAGITLPTDRFRDDVKQMECVRICLQFLSVPTSSFSSPTCLVMELLRSSPESQVTEFGFVFYILKAWYRICGSMGKDFLPYMSTVMSLLVKCVQLESDNLIDESDASIHKVKFGDEMIHARRSDFLKVKSFACSLLGSYAQILEEDFYPWISQVTSILVPLLKLCIYDDVREKSSQAMCCVLNSAKLAIEKGTAQSENDSYFNQLSCDTILAFGDALYSDPEIKLCAGILHSLTVCLEICGPLLSKDLLPSIVDVIKHVIRESSLRRGEFKEREKSEDFDAEEAELLMKEIGEEERIFSFVGDTLTTLIITFQAHFLPFFDELLSHLMPDKDKTAAEKSVCFYVFDILGANCDDATLKYYKIYLPYLLDSSKDENPYTRQCALYGLELCALRGPSIFKPFVVEALPRINEVITHIHAREPQNEFAYNNAVSALGKICQFHWESIDLPQQIIPVWLNCLPMKGDKSKAKILHSELCSMVERLDRELFGPKYEHFPKILSVFTEVLCAKEDLAIEETTNRMIIVLRKLKKTIPPVIWASAVSLLLPQQEMELESAVEDSNLSSI